MKSVGKPNQKNSFITNSFPETTFPGFLHLLRGQIQALFKHFFILSFTLKRIIKLYHIKQDEVVLKNNRNNPKHIIQKPDTSQTLKTPRTLIPQM